MAANSHGMALPVMRTFAQRQARLRSTLRFGRRKTRYSSRLCGYYTMAAGGHGSPADAQRLSAADAQRLSAASAETALCAV